MKKEFVVKHKMGIEKKIYIGYFAPSSIAEKYQNSVAGNNAELEFINNVLVYYDCLAVSYIFNSYGEKPLFKRGKYFSLDNNEYIKCYGIPTINIPILSQIFSSFVIFFLLLKEKLNNNSLTIITANSYPVISIPSLIIRFLFKNVSLISFLMDGFYYDCPFSRKVYKKIAIRCLHKYDKVISLSESVCKKINLIEEKYISITPVKVNNMGGAKYSQEFR